MIPLKFQAWDIKNKRWIKVGDLDVDVYGGVKRAGGVVVIDGVMDYQKLENSFPDDPAFIIIQFTGRKDKNGIEIYDGDIVETQYAGSNTPCKCVYVDGGFELIDLSNSHWKSTLAEHDSSHLERIGNSHEHPELEEAFA